MFGNSSRDRNTQSPFWLRCLPPFRAALDRMPPRCRPALFYETFYNVGAGAFVSLIGLSLAALKSDAIFPNGTKEHLMIVAAMFGGNLVATAPDRAVSARKVGQSVGRAGAGSTSASDSSRAGP